MSPLTLLEVIALALLAVHFSVPLVYYHYAKTRWLHKPWNLKVDPSYTPKVAIIIPTYMGSKYIAERLDNIYTQNYPKDKVEVIVVDSPSPDGTASIVREWFHRHPDVKGKLIEEPVRRGKLSAILKGLEAVPEDTEVVVLTDDDCTWDKDALRNTVKYFADPTVGAVTGSIKYTSDRDSDYNTYRSLYNMLRVAESKYWSTPIHNGPLLALRKSLIDKIGIPSFPGADDSAIGSYVAFAGYRAIQVEDAWVYEPLTKNQYKRMIRRAIHLVTYFRNLKKYAKQRGIYVKTAFDKIWNIEAYLHTINPILFLLATSILTASAILGSIPALTLLTLGATLLLIKPYRVWIINQLYLLIALLKSLRAKEITWTRE